ncbi:MAG: heme biosynthesis HemY N-terminal domain-containing protein, partial [Burkholderiaceae bacterium]
LIGVVVFAAAVGLALALSTDPGNVVVFYPPFRIDLSLNLVLLIEVVLFVVLYALIRIAKKTVQMPQRVALYRQRQSEKRASRALRGALQAHFEGRYGHAEREAEEAQELPETAGLAALVAARSAHRMREYARRDEWLRRAQADPGLRAAKLMTEAECLVDAREGTRALAVVAQLHAAGARHIQSLRLGLKAHQYAGDWDSVLKLLRTLNKRDALHPVAARQIKTLAYRALFAARGDDAHALLALWQTVPNADKRIGDVSLVAAQAFNAARLGYQARVVIENALLSEWDPRLAEEYARSGDKVVEALFLEGRGRDGRVVAEDARSQIERAERWTREHPTDPSAAYALGALCGRQKLWGKAQAALRGALDLAPEPRLAAMIHLELGRVFDDIDDPVGSREHYRAAALANLGG